ncbi:hypothetical protein ALC57_02292 [Trachymyrmex cornetzi]|uniref:Uncharacterized protein n=1 Tax=Trachymyrmex cornetzi TaxID=471704 RepID=A0A195EJY9_9HYME|nr:hypothetical protein ALC57_02292 [Trachymyrmex cornetzi]
MHCLQAVDGHCRVVWDRRSRHLNCTERQIRRQTRLRYSRLHPRATLSTPALDLVLLIFSRLYRGRRPSISVLPTRTLDAVKSHDYYGENERWKDAVFPSRTTQMDGKTFPPPA